MPRRKSNEPKVLAITELAFCRNGIQGESFYLGKCNLVFCHEMINLTFVVPEPTFDNPDSACYRLYAYETKTGNPWRADGIYHQLIKLVTKRDARTHEVVKSRP